MTLFTTGVMGSASGQIQLNPNSGGPTGYYYPAANRYDFNPKEALSQDYVDRHVRNIQQGLDSNGFVAPPTHLDNFRNWLGNGLIKIGKWVTPSDANGGTINYLDLFR